MTGENRDDPEFDKEELRMRAAVSEMTFAWADFENSSVLLLRAMLGDAGGLGSPIYFAVAGLETRLNIVDAAFREFVEGHDLEKEIVDAWDALRRSMI